MSKIDLHTHRLKSDAAIQILNVFAQDLPLAEDQNLYSAGLHPWHIGLVNSEACLQSISLAMRQDNVLALGECGLDRSAKVGFVTQLGYFRKQIELAEEHSKPLIIHCVRSFPELISLKKECKTTIPWIIHGSKGNHSTTIQLIRHDFYFSVGESLLKNQQKNEIVRLIPSDHLFLETDDGESSITEIYSLASQLLKIDEKMMTDNILENFKRLFGKEIIQDHKAS